MSSTPNITTMSAVTDLRVRQDLLSMSLPLFPDEDAGDTFTATLGAQTITIGNDREGRMALPADRKLINLLASVVAHQIRSGETPSRHLVVSTRHVLAAHSHGARPGGADYARLNERLDRLMGTFIETEERLANGDLRKRRFRWIAAYEHDRDPDTNAVHRLKISISEEAYVWITRTLGFDTAAAEFHAITSAPPSIWRIYEVCLFKIMMNRGRPARIPLAELRDRVPRTCELKIFKNRILKKAIDAINSDPSMGRHIQLSLEVAEPCGDVFTTLGPGKRCPNLERLHVRIEQGAGRLPQASALIPDTPISNQERGIRHQTA